MTDEERLERLKQLQAILREAIKTYTPILPTSKDVANALHEVNAEVEALENKINPWAQAQSVGGQLLAGGTSISFPDAYRLAQYANHLEHEVLQYQKTLAARLRTECPARKPSTV